MEKQQKHEDPRPLEEELGRLAARAVMEMKMIDDGDRILVAVSGGKDSYVMLRILQRMERIAPVSFELVAFVLEQGQPGFNVERVEKYLQELDLPYVIHHQDTYSVVREKIKPGTTTCSLCSRLRRGILYTQSEKLGCNKIALGHHRDDLIHTLLMNMFFTGQLKTMAPKLVSDSGRHMIIRPLAYCSEKTIARYARSLSFEPEQCTFCGTEGSLKRKMVRHLVDDLEAQHHGIMDSIFASMQHVRPTHLLDESIKRVTTT